MSSSRTGFSFFLDKKTRLPAWAGKQKNQEKSMLPPTSHRQARTFFGPTLWYSKIN